MKFLLKSRSGAMFRHVLSTGIVASLGVSCVAPRSEQGRFKELNQTRFMIEHDGHYWSRHVLAVQGFNYAAAPVSRSGDRIFLQMRRLGEARSAEDGDTRSLLTTNADQAHLKHENDNKQISLLQDLSEAKGMGPRSVYRIGGTNEIFLVGCLVKQHRVGAAASEQTLRDEIRVPRAPLLSGLNRDPAAPASVDMTTIKLREARWIWELIPDLNPNAREVTFLSSADRKRSDSSPLARLWMAAAQNVRDWYFFADDEVYRTTAGVTFFRTQPGGYAGYALSQAFPPEQAMLRRLAAQAQSTTSDPDARVSDGASVRREASVHSPDHICATLIEPVDTRRHYLSFGLEAQIDRSVIDDNERRFTISYLNAPLRTLKDQVDFVSANATGMGSATLFLSGSLLAIGMEPWLAFLPAPVLALIKGGFSTNMTLTSSAGLFSAQVNEMKKKQAGLRALLKESRNINLPEYYRYYAAAEVVLGTAQRTATSLFKARVAELLVEDAAEIPQRRLWPEASLVLPVFPEGTGPGTLRDADREEMKRKQLASYVTFWTKEQAGDAFAIDTPGSSDRSVQRVFESINKSVRQFVRTYPGDANALFNRALVQAFNSLPFGAQTSLRTFEHALGGVISDAEAARQLVDVWQRENILMMFRRIERRSLENSVLNHVSGFTPVGASPFSDEGMEDDVADAVRLYRKLLGEMLRSEPASSLGSGVNQEGFVASQIERAAALPGKQAGRFDFEELIWSEKLAEATDLISSLGNWETEVAQLKRKGAADLCPEQNGTGQGSCWFEGELLRTKHIAEKVSLMRFLLDALDQLRRASMDATCKNAVSGRLCQSITQAEQQHREANQRGKELCVELSSLAPDGSIGCSDTPAFVALSWLGAACSGEEGQGPLTPQECLGLLNNNLAITTEAGHWPAVARGPVTRDFLVQELRRLRSFHAPLTPPEERQVLKMESMGF